jgi:integrase
VPRLSDKETRNAMTVKDQTHLKNILSPESLARIFSKPWASGLLVKYFRYLQETGIAISSIRKNVDRAKKILLLAESAFLSPLEINIDWVEKSCEQGSKRLKLVKTSLLCFLQDQGILKIPDQNDRLQAGIMRQIERVPTKFRRLVDIYCQTRLDLRKRQINHNEAIPLSLRTINSDIEIFFRFIRWLNQEHQEVSSWDMIQENHIHEFLLILTPKNREIVRKDLHVLFQLAKRRKLITYIPMTNYPSRELPSTTESLSMTEQKQVAKILLQSVYSNPLGCLLGCLCFFHGLTTKQIQSIKLSDVDLNGKKIIVKDRPPVYLSREELLALQNYAELRSRMRNIKRREYLVIGDQGARFYENKPLGARAILKKVKSLTGYTPEQLRITCYHSFSAGFGPLMLIEAFGLSRTQASRYGRFEEYLLEEEIKLQRDSDNEGLEVLQ